jgi:hypothetical protein
VLAVDRDASALARCIGAGITTCQVDLEGADADSVRIFQPNRFAGVIVTNYLHRALFPHILASLAPGGMLIYETFAIGNEQFGKPSNPDFLLAEGELLRVAAGGARQALRVVAYEEDYVDLPKPAVLQRICAVKAATEPAVLD